MLISGLNLPIFRSKKRAKVATTRLLLVDVKVTGGCIPSSKTNTSCPSESGNITLRKPQNFSNFAAVVVDYFVS